MIRKLLASIIALALALLLARLPIFPLIVEMREISQTGESLSQEWRFVSMPEFYDSAQFAQSGWLETTWNNYRILFLVNHVVLVVAFLYLWRLLNRLFKKRE